MKKSVVIFFFLICIVKLSGFCQDRRQDSIFIKLVPVKSEYTLGDTILIKTLLINNTENAFYFLKPEIIYEFSRNTNIQPNCYLKFIKDVKINEEGGGSLRKMSIARSHIPRYSDKDIYLMKKGDSLKICHEKSIDNFYKLSFNKEGKYCFELHYDFNIDLFKKINDTSRFQKLNKLKSITLISNRIEISIKGIDTTNNPCYKFNELKTAEEYFESANIRTKGCPTNDSMITIIAAKEYSRAIELNPKFWQARRNYARQLIRLKQYDLAIEQLNEALELTSSEENPDLNFMRGQAFYKEGNYEKAIEDFDINIKYMIGADIKYVGNIDFVLLCKAKAQWKLGQLDKACENYKKSIALTPRLTDEKEFIVCE